MHTLKDTNSIFTADAAKNLVFDHWDFLSKLAGKRFPEDTEMSDQALSFVLYKLEEEDWQRIRSWDGHGSFENYLAVVSMRQMTDFVRSRFLCHRPPAWLQEKKDAVWQKAFRLYAVEKYQYNEALEALYSSHSEMSLDDLEEVVNTVYSKCADQTKFSEDDFSFNQVEALVTVDADLPDTLNNRLIEILMEYIQSDTAAIDTISNSKINHLLSRLKLHTNMSDEDRLILRLKFCEGLKVREIGQKLNLEDGVYLRINALLDDIKSAFQHH
ncbi:MAG: hypothetical protein V3V22_00355 [Methylococcales bacterium]